MDALLFASNESQWMLCLAQVTGLLLVGWLIGRVTLRKFPDVAALIGVIVLTSSAALMVATIADVPRPFELRSRTHEVTDLATNSESSLTNVDASGPDAAPNASVPTWWNQLASFVSFSTASPSSNITSNRQRFITPDRFIGFLILLTLLGGLIGIFRVAHSSNTIRALAQSSSPIDNQYVRSEVDRIVARLPTTLRHQDISVHQLGGLGSPFVSWLTGNRIFVPETFLEWSTSEQSAGLAHEISHLQRRDHYCRLLTQLAICLTWLHPLAWLLHRQTVLAQELAADQLATQASANPFAYCRGLSRLALRFDAECRYPSALGVSVSSSLIRRITMLKEITFHRLPCSRHVNRCISLSALIACTWIACWSVKGQTATQETTTDANVVAASHTVPVKMFSQPTTKPWESLGSQPGYLKIDLNRILEHRDLKPYRALITGSLDGVLHGERNDVQSLKKFGLDLENITQIQSGVMVSLRYAPEQPDGHHFALDLGMSAMEITAANKVDWPGLIKAVDLSKVIFSGFSEENLNEIREAWLKSAKVSHSNVFQAAKFFGEANAKWKQPNRTKKAMWDSVSGGVVTVVYDIVQSGEEFPDEHKVPGELSQANLNMTVVTETAAWGLDLTPDNESCLIRFAAVPKADVSTAELQGKFEELRKEIVKSIGPSEDEFAKQFLEQLEKLKVSVVEGKEVEGERTKDYLLIEGEYSASLINLLNFRNAETE